ncbi:hypothetical protein [Streptomyces sp. NPDC093225]|uniref:hypothetical protein n=1 Tax=Streptomyces sp. NPDC093225 TaxID=3366034 RepID=UPI0038111217
MRLKSTLIAATAAFAAVMGLATPSTAAGSVAATRADLDRSWGYARVQMGWTVHPYKIDPIAIHLEDKLTDGYTLGIRIGVEYGSGHVLYRWRFVEPGSASGQWTTYADGGRYPYYAFFEMCKFKNGVASSCLRSKIMENPADDSGVSG